MKRAPHRPFGVHVSIAGGLHRAVDRAVELGCTACQIFTHNPRGWAITPLRPDVREAFRDARRREGLYVVAHASYLINLASPRTDLRERSVGLLKTELDRADELDIDHVIVHTGCASDSEPADARRRAVEALRLLARFGPWKARLLLENTAGQRGDVSSSPSDLAELLDGAPGSVTGGVCIDSCHAFAAGYDFRTPAGMKAFVADLDRRIGRDRVHVLHLNDALKGPGSRVDRHAHLGDGEIGEVGLRRFLNHPALAGRPVILETPKKSEEDDSRNLRRLGELMSR